MIAFPNAKINIGLNILGKRTDGFHDLLSCFYPVPWCDIIEIIEGKETSFNATGIAIPDDNQDNLCLRAYQMLSEEFHLPPVNIRLHKVIPIGAGLGGGSADAAFTLKLLNEKFTLDLAPSDLEQYAARLGSDCAFFVKNQPAIASGRGEVLTGIDFQLDGFTLVLINPGIHISTAEAYRNVSFSQPMPPGEWLDRGKMDSWRELVQNDFEKSLFPTYPELQVIKDGLYEDGAIYASMTGSGSTLYGLFSEPIDLDYYREKDYLVFQQELGPIQ